MASDERLPDVLCISCDSVCSVDVDTRTATCTGMAKDGNACPQKYGFRDDACTHNWFGPYATLFGEIDDVKTLTWKVEYESGMARIWAALRAHLGRTTVAEYHELVAASQADWDRAARDYAAEKGWNQPRPRWWHGLRRVFSRKGATDDGA